jgi:hypothetical protein
VTNLAVTAALNAIRRHWADTEGDGGLVVREDFAGCCVEVGLAAAKPYLEAQAVTDHLRRVVGYVHTSPDGRTTVYAPKDIRMVIDPDQLDPR